MGMKLTEGIGLKHRAVALIWSDRPPEKAMQFAPGKWGCIMWLIAGAARGKTAVCDRQTFGCFGGGVGVGFGNQYLNFPGGEACFCHFLSSGNQGWEPGRQAAERVKPFLRKESYENFVHGERYIKTPELVEQFIAGLPMVDIPSKYVIFKPLAEADGPGEEPRVVILFADPDQLAALVVLANYGRRENESVIIPFAAGCQTACLYPYREAASKKPRAVVGLTDLSARLSIRSQLGDNLFTFSVPYAMYREMEADVEGSFLTRPTWLELIKGRQ
jgi:Uncharacterised ArCR, COG2043